MLDALIPIAEAAVANAALPSAAVSVRRTGAAETAINCSSADADKTARSSDVRRTADDRTNQLVRGRGGSRRSRDPSLCWAV